MEIEIERLTALALAITCLSHITAPRAWALFFIRMRRSGEVAGLYHAYVHGPLGMIILAFHPVWSWPGLLTTLVGLGLTLKGLVYFLYPALAQRSLAQASVEQAWRFRVAGVLMLPLPLAIFWLSLR